MEKIIFTPERGMYLNIILIYFSIKYHGDWDAIYKALESKEKVSLEEINKIEALIKEKDYKVFTILDNDYPNVLKEAYKPPFVIWYKGNKALMNKSLIYTTGNKVDQLTDKRIKTFNKEFEDRYTLISASYQGVDKEVLKVSAKPMIHVESKGLDRSSLEIKDNDLIITEYPEGTEASNDTYRSRNRLLAALASSLVLYSSDKDGPINHLVTSFLNLGKEIYCFPDLGEDNDGNSELIKQGASLITSPKDIVK